MLTFTSFFFLSNVIGNVIAENWRYAFAFYCLSISSIVHHDTHSTLTFWIDQFFIAVVVITGFVVFSTHIPENTGNLELTSGMFDTLKGVSMRPSYMVNQENILHVGCSADYTLIAGTIISVLFVTIIYHVGRKYNILCFDPVYEKYYHALLHFVSSIGHHYITMMSM